MRGSRRPAAPARAAARIMPRRPIRGRRASAATPTPSAAAPAVTAATVSATGIAAAAAADSLQVLVFLLNGVAAWSAISQVRLKSHPAGCAWRDQVNKHTCSGQGAAALRMLCSQYRAAHDIRDCMLKPCPMPREDGRIHRVNDSRPHPGDGRRLHSERPLEGPLRRELDEARADDPARILARGNGPRSGDDTS